ncbi:MAG: PspC domain-containing protein [Actinomycetia bacterium]|nr:PspC domain-containing protein [Actinomycetes bacterium]
MSENRIHQQQEHNQQDRGPGTQHGNPGAQHGGPGAQPGAGGGTSVAGFFQQIRGFGIRRGQDRWIAGVCRGIADRLGVDPLIVRAMMILALMVGIGFLAYLMAWALLPDSDGSILAEKAILDGDGAGVTLLVFIVLIALSTGPLLADSNPFFGLLPALAVIAVVWWWLSRRDGTSRGPSGATPPHGTAPPYPGSTPQHGTTPPHGSAPYPMTTTPPTWAPAGSSPATGYEPPPADESASAREAHPGAGGWDQPPPAYRERAPRAGMVGLALVIGLALIGAGAGFGLAGVFGTATTVAALLGATAGAGLATVALGIAGRRAALASLISLALATSLAATSAATFVTTEDQRWSPTATSTEAGYHANFGSGTLDLRGITSTPTESEINASVNFGELVVYVPDEVSTRVIASAQFGKIALDGRGPDALSESSEGMNTTRDYVFGEGEPELTVVASTRFGEVRIITSVMPEERN